MWRSDKTGQDATTRGRETTQQSTKGTNEWTNKQTKQVRREVTTRKEVKTRREGMEAEDDCFGPDALRPTTY
jgi:hypothetical protein